MRISERYRIDIALTSLSKNQHSLDKLRAQAATGKRILAPDDDPQGTQRAVTLRSYLAATDAALRDIDFSQDWMDASAVALRGLDKVLGTARVAALQAANETLSDKERTVIASQIHESLKQAVDIANSDHRGQRLFAGFKTNTQPFTLDDTNLTVTYGGDDGAINHEIEAGSQMTVNVPGSNPMFAASFKALKDLYDGLTANDTPAIRQSVDALDQASDQTELQISMLGTRSKAVHDARDRLQAFNIDLKSLLSKVEDTDMAESAVYVAMSAQQYQVTLTTLGRDTLQSLFDYLG